MQKTHKIPKTYNKMALRRMEIKDEYYPRSNQTQKLLVENNDIEIVIRAVTERITKKEISTINYLNAVNENRKLDKALPFQNLSFNEIIDIYHKDVKIRHYSA